MTDRVYADSLGIALSEPRAGAVTCTAASTTLVTPASDRRLRLRWLSLSSTSTGTECVVTVSFGGTQVLYLWGLPAPGAFSRRSIREADNVGDALVIQLSPTGGPVYVNYEVEEV